MFGIYLYCVDLTRPFGFKISDVRIYEKRIPIQNVDTFASILKQRKDRKLQPLIDGKTRICKLPSGSFRDPPAHVFYLAIIAQKFNLLITKLRSLEKTLDITSLFSKKEQALTDIMADSIPKISFSDAVKKRCAISLPHRPDPRY